jgi:hypothetical protein
MHAIKLVGSGLTGSAFTATPSCPPYARITLRLPDADFACNACNAYNTGWTVSELSYNSVTSVSPSVPAGCTSPFQAFVPSQGGVYVTKSGEYRVTLTMTYQTCANVSPAACHAWVEIVAAAASGKGTSRVASYYYTGAAPVFPSVAASFSLSDTDLPTLVAVRFYTGNILNVGKRANILNWPPSGRLDSSACACLCFLLFRMLRIKSSSRSPTASQ